MHDVNVVCNYVCLNFYEWMELWMLGEVSIVSLMLRECKVCTQNARSALTKSFSVPKLRRDNTKPSLCKECKETGARHAQSSARIQTLRKDMVQGVQRSEIWLSVEGTLQEIKEPEKENARKARRISLSQILQIWVIKISEVQGVHGK